MSAEVIQFSAAGPRRTTHQVQKSSLDAVGRGGTMTTTMKNRRLRDERKEAWRRADAVTNYWKARLQFMDAASIAARRGLREEGCHYCEIDHKARWAVLESYRAAIGKQLLTLAPDVASVNWKRAHMTKVLIEVKRERVEQAIADDMAFLGAHPTRSLKAKA
jgi:hypothetical protein